ncbi:hypothetical protein ES708_34930 [subsurface metagenome]
MAKYKVIKKFIKGKTGEEIEIGRVVDIEEDRIEAFKELGIINKPIKEKKGKKKKE